MWLVGQIMSAVIDKENGVLKNINWDFQGVFDDREKAIATCKNPWYFIMGEFEINQEFSEDRTETMKDGFYPLWDELSSEDYYSRVVIGE